MGFPTLVPLCDPIRVTYAPAGDTPILDILLLRIKDSKDSCSVGSFVGTLSNAQNKYNLVTFVNQVNKSMSRFTQPYLVAACEFSRKGV